MKSDEALQQDIENALAWEPSLSAAEIGVSVRDGIVTLSGSVDSYQKKLEAEHATKNVAGVKALVEDIEIKIPHSVRKNDEDIAAEVLKALSENWTVPYQTITVKVEKGWVYLVGTVAWEYQRRAAKNALTGLIGIHGIINLIQVESVLPNDLEKSLLEKALQRDWTIDSEKVRVNVSGRMVTLTGTVSSLYQKEEAERIAWKTPGIWTVSNELAVDHALYFPSEAHLR